MSFVSTAASFCGLPVCKGVSLATGLLAAGAFAGTGQGKRAVHQLEATVMGMAAGFALKPGRFVGYEARHLKPARALWGRGFASYGLGTIVCGPTPWC
jgi:hypothetical protein